MGVVEEFENLTADSIDEFIRNKQEETVHLEFKGIDDAELKSRPDRKNLAKAISGFANSDGGVILWGVDARKNSDGIDCAQEKLPIKPLQRFMSRLNELTSEATSPIVDGVCHRSIPLPNRDEGFAATLVPVSDSGPHLAKLGEDRYFKRSGDSFIRMEHFDLEDMFGRRQRPVLILDHRVVRGGDSAAGKNRWPYSLILSLRNSGRGSARAPFLALLLEPPWRTSSFGIDGNRHEGLPRLTKARDSRWFQFGGSAETVIHPGTSIDVTAVTCPVEFRDVPHSLHMEYRVAAIRLRVVECNLRISASDLVKAALETHEQS